MPNPEHEDIDPFRAFAQAPHTLAEAPGVRAAWHKGRPSYAVWVLRVRSEAVAERAARVAAHLAPWLVPSDRESLHITLWVAGFPCETPQADDDVARAVLTAQAIALDQAASLLSRPLQLQIGGLGSFTSAAYLDVIDEQGALRHLREALMPHGRELRFERYLPHVTVGVYDGAHATAPIVTAMRDLRALPAIAIDVNELALVELDTHAPGAPLRTRVSVPL